MGLVLGNPTGDVLIISHRRASTLTQYFTWFGKTAYIHKRESILFRDRERYKINTWRRITFTQLPPQPHCCQWQQGCCPWQQLLFLSSSLHVSHTLHSHILLLTWCLFIGKWWLLFSFQLHMLHLSMVGATTIDKWSPYILG